MNRIIALILFLAFIVQSFDGAFITINYYLNSSAYAKNCENKNKPMLHCNGKCQLVKKLQQEENNKSFPDRRSENKSEIMLYSKFLVLIAKPVIITKNLYPGILFTKETKMPRYLFHPPGILA